MTPPTPFERSPSEQALNHATKFFYRLVSSTSRDAFDIAVAVTLVTVVIATGFAQNALSTATTPAAVLGESAGDILQATVG